VERIKPERLRSWLEDPEVYILDVRTPPAWESSQVMIPGAHRFNPRQPLETRVKNIPRDKKIVAY